ncbi:hypothetical protein FIBSPDRAFT_690520, partial [Athelia psychrophila]
GHVRGEKSALIAHILGGKAACVHASSQATAAATTLKNALASSSGSSTPTSASSSKRTGSVASLPDSQPGKKSKQTSLLPHAFKGNDMPFSPPEAAAFQAQALRAVISANLPFRVFEDLEMIKLFEMMRSKAPDVLPSRKVIGGRLLDEAGAVVESKIDKLIRAEIVGLTADGWKSLTKSAVNGICVNVNYKSYTLQLVDVTSANKDGIAMANQFESIIDQVESRYDCTVAYFVTDADGGSKKGRVLLGKRRPYLIVPSCWAHQFQLTLGDYFKEYEYAQEISEAATALIGWINNHGKVRTMFDNAQKQITQDRDGYAHIVTYLVANLTRWTTHCIAFIRLLRVKDALKLEVMQHRGALIKAQVGAATYTEKERLTEDAETHCDLIADSTFWNGLEHVVSDIEPICYATNINQKDSTRADQVLLSLAGIFLHFCAHPIEDVRLGMMKRLEKRWKDYDQPLYLIALILNPFEALSSFGDKAGMDHFKCNNLLLQLYRRMMDRPSNTDLPSKRQAKERAVSAAFFQYLASTGPFDAWKEQQASYEEFMERDPIMVWSALECHDDVAELARFAKMILKFVVNQAGCERLFSDLQVKKTQRRNRLGLPKLEKMTKIGADIKAEHQTLGAAKRRLARKVHKSTSTLLAVPR